MIPGKGESGFPHGSFGYVKIGGIAANNGCWATFAAERLREKIGVPGMGSRDADDEYANREGSDSSFET